MQFYNRLSLLVLVLTSLCLSIACNEELSFSDNTDSIREVEPTLTAESPLLQLLPSEQTGIDFVNTITETPENNILKNTNFYNGGGLAVADINNDGLPDLYFINCDGKNGLYLNQGKLKFKNITDGSGLESVTGFETSVTAADVNADGYLDFYVCLAGPFEPEKRRNRLYINNKNNTFTESAAAYGLNAGNMSTGANFFDYDRDGDLDLYLLNYPTNFGFASKVEADIDPATNEYRPRLKPKTEFDSGPALPEQRAMAPSPMYPSRPASKILPMALVPA